MMDASTILAKVDHTLLAPNATFGDITRLCNEALSAKTASVCVNPRFVPLCAGLLRGQIPVCTVVGFPLGANTTGTKVFEAGRAVADGAAEIDMVISIGDALAGDYTRIRDEVCAVKKAIGTNVLKVIIECCLLNDSQKVTLCRILEDCGADFVKTSTGFSKGGATFHDVKLLKSACNTLKIKAAGGIRTVSAMETFIELGADRLGSSSAVGLFLPAVDEARRP